MTKKRYAFSLLGWFFVGHISWHLSVLFFSYGLSRFTTPVLKFLKSNIPFLIEPGSFLLFHISEFIFGAILAGIICYYSASRVAFLLSFIAGASWYALYISITTFVYYSENYPKVPSWAMTVFIQNIIAILIGLPGIVFVTCRFVNNRKTNIAQQGR